MISVAFCFDNNVVDYLKVSIASLLINKNINTHYNIIGICSNNAIEVTKEIKNLVELIDSKSEVNIKENLNDYSTGYEIRNITNATYYRFDIADLFPELDKVLYLDVDTLIMDDLSDLWGIDMGTNYICGVRADVNIYDSWHNKRRKFSYWKDMDDIQGNYINAGVLLMNLKTIREKEIASLWKEKISYNYFYQDQDILNLCCKHNIGIIPMRYNSLAFYTDTDYKKLALQNIYNEYEIEYANNNPVIIHYAGKKPWLDLNTRKGNLWWSFVQKNNLLKVVFEERYLKLKSLKLSIIIPVYNSEKYLRECLESIYKQDSEEYEIICIDDGSTDHSLCILEEYKSRFYNYKIIVQDHKGLSVARNEGIKVARGQYVYFVDSDDVIVDDFINKALYCAIDMDLDVLLFSFENFCNDKNTYLKHKERIEKRKHICVPEEIMDGRGIMRYLIQHDEYYPTVWIQITKRKLLIDNFLLFYKGIVFEDVLYTFRLLWIAKKVKCILDIGYRKRIHDESICGRPENIYNVVSLWRNYKKLIALCEEYNISENDEFIVRKMIDMCKSQLIRHYQNLSEIDRNNFKKELTTWDEIKFDIVCS